MENPPQNSTEQQFFVNLSNALKASPSHYNYTFTNNTRKQLINLATWYLLGCDDRLSKLVVIDERTGGALRDEKVEKSIELIEYTEVRRGQLCGHVFKRGEGVYRCKTCAIDDTCVLCTRCFHATNHSGHDTSFSINSGTGGCCDCGEQEAWKQSLHCRYHATLEDLKENNIEPIIQQNSSFGIDGYQDSTVPESLLMSIKGTIRAVLEFMLLTFSTAPIPDNSKLDLYHISQDVNKMNSILGESFSEPIYSIVLWNDETHSFQDFLDVIQDALECSLEDAKQMVKSVDSKGRDVIAISSDINKLFKIAEYMKRVSLNVTIRSARDVFREQLAASLLIWLRDLACSKFRPLIRLCMGNANIQIRSEICRQLSSEWEEYNTNGFLKRIIDDQLLNDSDDIDNFDECVVEPDFDSEADFVPYREVVDEDDNIILVPAIPYNNESFYPQHSALQGQNLLYPNQFQGAQNTSYTDYSPKMVPQFSQNVFSGKRRLSNTSIQNNFESPEVKISHPNANRGNSKADDSRKNKQMRFPNTPLPSSYPKGKYIGKFVNNRNMEKLWQIKKKLKIDWLLMVDLQLWKETRSGLRELYLATMMLDPGYKMQMSISFGRNYPRLTNAFLSQDQGPEHSVLLFSVQLFTVPTVSVALVREYGFLYTVLRMLKKFFIKPTPKYLRQSGIILCDTESFRNRRYFHIFHDMRYLASALSVPEWIATEKQFLNAYLGFIALFQGMSPNKRAQDVHVEFEDDTWVHAFNVTLQVAKSCRQFADCYKDHLHRLVLAIRGTLRKLTKKIFLLSEENMFYIIQNGPHYKDYYLQLSNLKDIQYLPFMTHERSTLQGISYKLVKYSVSKDPVSFHHPLHWFLANLFRHIELLDDESIKLLGFKNLREVIFTFNILEFDDGTNNQETSLINNDILLLKIVDYSIRVIVLMAQIRSRMWSRNGFVVKSQAHHYREISLRENTFDQDIFLVQFFLCLWDDPDHILLTILDRFELIDWFSGNFLSMEPENQPYPPDQLISLVDEFLGVLIVLVTDRVVASGQSSRELSKREIIHGCLEITSYSDLVKKVPERLAEHPEFDSILIELANYRPPTSVMDTGMYELKDGYLDCVDLHFIHYNRNQREEAEDILFSRINKHNRSIGDSSLSNEKPIILPKLIEVKKGPFKNLGLVLHSPLSCQILFYSLHNSTTKEQKAIPTSVLDQTLHLIIVALFDGLTGSIKSKLALDNERKLLGGLYKYALELKFNTKSFGRLNLLELLLIMENSVEYRQWRARLKLVIKLFEDTGDFLKTSIQRLVSDLKSRGYILHEVEPEKEQDPAVFKKEAAKLRQSQIMEDFAKAQKSFLENYSSILGDLSDEDDPMNANSNTYSLLEDDLDSNKETKCETEDEFENQRNSSQQPPEQSEFEKEKPCIQAHKDPSSSNKHQTRGANYFGKQNQTQMKYTPKLLLPSGICIVCQETCDSSKPFGALALLQSTFILRQTPLNSVRHVKEILSNKIASFDIEQTSEVREGFLANKNLDKNNSINQKLLYSEEREQEMHLNLIYNSNLTEDLLYLYKDTNISVGAPSELSSFPPHYHSRGMFSSTCGHLIHQTCFDRYYREVKMKHQRQPTRNHPELIERQEFLCPLCNTLGNFLLPVFPENLGTSEIKESELLHDKTDPSYAESWLSDGISDIFQRLGVEIEPGINNGSRNSTSKKYKEKKPEFSSKKHIFTPYIPASSSQSASTTPSGLQPLRTTSSMTISSFQYPNALNSLNFEYIPFLRSDPFDFNKIRDVLTHIFTGIWPLQGLNESSQAASEIWNTIRTRFFGNIYGDDQQFDLYEWRMLVPIYLYIFVLSTEWRQHVNKTALLLKQHASSSPKANQETKGRYFNNSTGDAPSLSSQRPEYSNSRDRLQSGIAQSSSNYISSSMLPTEAQRDQTRSRMVEYPLNPNPGFSLQTNNPRDLSINSDPSELPLSYPWVQFGNYSSSVSHAIAGSPPYPGHSGVSIQNVFRSPINSESNEIQNNNNQTADLIYNTTGISLNFHLSNERFEFRENMLTQLLYYTSIYKQFVDVLKIIQQDVVVGLPNPKEFNHLANLSYQKLTREHLAEPFVGSEDHHFSHEFSLSAISNKLENSDCSSNSEPVLNENVQNSAFRTQASHSTSECKHDSIATSNLGALLQQPLDSTKQVHLSSSSAGNNYTRTNVHYQSFQNSNDALNPELPPLESAADDPSQRPYRGFSNALNESNDIPYNIEKSKKEPHSIEMPIIRESQSQLFENIVSDVFAQTIMCLEVGARGKNTPKVFDMDDPRRTHSSGIWIDSISSTQLAFVYALGRFSKIQFQLLLSETISLSEYCLNTKEIQGEFGNKSSYNRIVSDIASSFAMDSVRHSTRLSLLALLEPFRTDVNTFDLPNSCFSIGFDGNNLPKRPFLMEDPFTLLTRLCVSLVESVKVNPWILVRLSFIVEIVRVCISVGDSACGSYAGAPSEFSSTTKPISEYINTNTGGISDFKSKDQSDPSFANLDFWHENSEIHNLPLADQFSAVYKAVQILEPGYKGSLKDLDNLICNLVAWVRSLAHPQSTRENFDIIFKHFTKTVPEYSISMLVIKLMIPFMRRASSLLYLLYGVVNPFASQLDLIENPDVREFVNLWQFLRLSEPSTIFSVPAPQSTVYQMANRWIKQLFLFRSAHKSPISTGAGFTMLIPISMPSVYSLVKLPHNFETLFEMSYKAYCMKCKSIPPDPCLCLICGRFVCAQSFCCLSDDMGECNLHMQLCGGTTGFYLPVKKCALLMLNNQNGCFIQAPYLDIHGEVDLGMKRGRPLYLHEKRYEEIRKAVVNHTIPATVARKIEQTFDMGGWITM
ncbi:hypothetical protein BB560_003520 [Smittium megazygosporum]|uniref:E3 ubiquitin-protein ligase n=1 Tax=Smittium megazygosporum TaxID=133381 RepID=A0A2T9ZBR2_9FUNG|nr:hypothetical protein BB560_003520 [Smittium megazygosporum]